MTYEKLGIQNQGAYFGCSLNEIQMIRQSRLNDREECKRLVKDTEFKIKYPLTFKKLKFNSLNNKHDLEVLCVLENLLTTFTSCDTLQMIDNLFESLAIEVYFILSFRYEMKREIVEEIIIAEFPKFIEPKKFYIEAVMSKLLCLEKVVLKTGDVYTINKEYALTIQKRAYLVYNYRCNNLNVM